MQIKYIFFSDKLGFRNWKKEDVEPYARLSSDPEVMRFFPKQFWLDNDSAERSVRGLKDHQEKYGFTYFAVDLLETNEFIGFIGMKRVGYEVFFAPAVDIGWRLDKRFWGKGYATEGARAAMKWFFENFKEDRLVSLTPTTNLPSENVMKKIGMNKVCEFDFPILDPDDPLLKHVLYEIKNI